MIVFKTAAWSLIACMGSSALPQPSWAQTPPVAAPDDPVASLGRNIRILANSPRDLSALMGAGRAALDVGDPNAALGFFARAEEVAPSNGAAKAGLGSSLVAIERPDDALRLFSQAVALGVSEASIARDRGLAYDLRGDNQRAQRDYALALTRGRDDELIRRYALSKGISGDRTAAVDLLQPLLRRQDQGAWRARAFVLAMTGDVPGAQALARQLMVPAMAAAMTPLLTRLATLNSAERAHAVNFGTVPPEGTQVAVQTGDPFAATEAHGQTSAKSVSATGTTMPGANLIPSGVALGPTGRPDRALAKAVPQPLPKPSPAPTVAAHPPSLPMTATTVSDPAVPLFETPASPRTQLALAKPATPAPLAPAPEVVSPKPSNRLAGLLADVEPEAQTAVDLPTARELKLARAIARKKIAELAAQAAAEKAEKAAASAQALAAKRFPARTWVQVATGRNETGFALSWRRIRNDHATLLTKENAWSVPYKATNRILVGPFKSTTSARAMISKLSKDGLNATLYDSEAGEEVTKIDGK